MGKLFVKGDINAFFGLMLDNVTNLVILTGILSGIFGFPLEIILKKMIPGTALGVMFGDLVYTWMAVKLSKKEGRTDITAMPLGLDTPSTVGIALTVLGPVYLQTKDPNMTLYVGMAVMMIMGIVKLVFSFIGPWIQKVMPQAGLLGSIGGIGLVFLGFFPLIDIFKLPIVGIASLGIIIYAFFAKNRLPFKMPPVLAAVAFGTILYYLLPIAGEHASTASKVGFYPPIMNFDFLKGMEKAINYIPIALPFGILTIIGGINVTESAKLAGDNYNTKNILLTEAIATLIAGMAGGVAQSTPYIGHPAYKQMGAKAGYTLATGLFIGIGAMFGIIGSVVELIPVAAVGPVLIFVGFEIAAQSINISKKEMVAVLLAFIPSIANLILIEINSILGFFGKTVNDLAGDMLQTVKAITILGNGFILTAMLWGSAVSFLINKKLKEFSITMFSIIVFTLFGIIHSVNPDGSIYFPEFSSFNNSLKIAIGYLIFAVLTVLMTKCTKKEIN